MSRAHNYDRVLVLHRWTPDGNDVVVVASLDENPKWGYRIGLPFAGSWKERLNTHYYQNFPNPGTIGNGGWVQADWQMLDGFAASAYLVLPPMSVLVLTRG